MNDQIHSKLQQRVVQAAAAVMRREGRVGLLDLFQEMRLLPPGHYENWRKGHEGYRALLPWIQVGPAKLRQTIDYFREWANQAGCLAIEAAYTRRGPRGLEPLVVTEDGNLEAEQFYRTYYVPGDLTAKKLAKLTAKLKAPPELVVFEKVGEDGKCSECHTDLFPGDFLLLERGQPLCLTCADLDHLVFLPAGDTALTRRARQHSPLSAVVVRYSRARNRYERQGLLVTEAAVMKAEEQCVADAPARMAARARAGIAREAEDRQFVGELTQAILLRYPKCPVEEARQIAKHAGQRNSGRVGRSAAGRELEASAVDLAVIAHIRHTHTKYDELLMTGTERLDARAQVREDIHRVLQEWSEG